MHGQTLNVASLARDAGVARQTVSGYVQILEDTLIASTLGAFEARLRVRERRHPKLYLFDPGVVRALKRQRGPVAAEERGALLEGFVFMLLRFYRERAELWDDIGYWAPAEAATTEVDFVISPAPRVMAIEVKATKQCASGLARAARHRGTSGTREARARLSGSSGAPHAGWNRGVAVRRVCTPARTGDAVALRRAYAGPATQQPVMQYSYWAQPLCPGSPQGVLPGGHCPSLGCPQLGSGAGRPAQTSHGSQGLRQPDNRLAGLAVRGVAEMRRVTTSRTVDGGSEPDVVAAARGQLAAAEAVAAVGGERQADVEAGGRLRRLQAPHTMRSCRGWRPAGRRRSSSRRSADSPAPRCAGRKLGSSGSRRCPSRCPGRSSSPACRARCSARESRRSRSLRCCRRDRGTRGPAESTSPSPSLSRQSPHA